MAKQQKVPIKNLPKEYSPEDLSAIGQDIIDYIIKRTKKGRGVDNQPWKGSEANRYSNQYKESLDFKIAGKSKNKVDLELSGDMLSMLDVLEIKKGKIVIGYPSGDKNLNGKVEGNRIGSYGRDPNPKKARDFLEVSNQEIEKILKKYPIENEEKRSKRTQMINKLIEEGKTYKAQELNNQGED
ncbi:MAG: hypothetical protein ACP5N7_00970 [Candidatus Pacearchaeota archaeon]